MMYMKRVLAVFLVGVLTVPVIHGQDVDLKLSMPSRFFVPGNPCSLDLIMENIGPEYAQAAAFVALDVGVGNYWFSPSWRRYPGGFDYHPVTIPGHGTTTVGILPSFPWPSGAGTFMDASFIAAVTRADGRLISNIALCSFGWMDHPILNEINPISAAPGRTIWVYGLGMGGDMHDIYATIGDIPVPAMTVKTLDNGVDMATFVVPIIDPGAYTLTLHTADETSNSLVFTVNALPATGMPHGDVVAGMDSAFDVLGTVFKTDIVEGAIARGDIPASQRTEYTAAMDRADAVFDVFIAEWSNLAIEEQEMFEKIMMDSGIFSLFADLEKTAHAFNGTDHANDMQFYMMVDATSACLTAIDIAWSAIDVAAAIAALSSGGVGLALPAVAGGIQLGLKIADKALDGFVTSDLQAFGIEDGSMGDQYVEVDNGSTQIYTLHGLYNAQMTWQKASFTTVLDIMLFGFFEKLPFSESAKDQAIKSILNFVTGILNNIGISMTEDILSLTGPPSQSIVTVDYDYMKEMGIQQALATTNFGAGVLNGPIALYLYLTETYPGYEVDDTSIADVSFTGESIFIKGKKKGITQLTIRGVRFTPYDIWYLFSPEIFSKVETRFNIEVKEDDLFLYADGMMGCEGREAALFFSDIPLSFNGSNYSFTGYGAGNDYDGDPIYFIVTGSFYLNPLYARVDVAMYNDPGYVSHIRTDRAEAYPVYEDWFYDNACTLIADTSAGCVPIWLGIRFGADRSAGIPAVVPGVELRGLSGSPVSPCTLTLP
ncbi:IPT/TIG domain-containing protein [bacterium]|nr:IPT/TIG domain-containing protein [candidate division CSSED10-310 bacterium]